MFFESCTPHTLQQTSWRIINDPRIKSKSTISQIDVGLKIFPIWHDFQQSKIRCILFLKLIHFPQKNWKIKTSFFSLQTQFPVFGVVQRYPLLNAFLPFLFFFFIWFPEDYRRCLWKMLRQDKGDTFYQTKIYHFVFNQRHIYTLQQLRRSGRHSNPKSSIFPEAWAFISYEIPRI